LQLDLLVNSSGSSLMLYRQPPSPQCCTCSTCEWHGHEEGGGV